MPRESKIDDFVESTLDDISNAGQHTGKTVNYLFKNIKKILFALGVVAGFGLVLFVWSLLKGLRSKK